MSLKLVAKIKRCHELYIPNSVTSIEENAFEDCKRLTIVTAAGSYAEQYAIKNEIAYKTE